MFLSFILNGHTVAPHEQAFEYFISAYTMTHFSFVLYFHLADLFHVEMK